MNGLEVIIDIEAFLLIALVVPNAYFVRHGLGLFRRVPSPLLNALLAVKISVAALTVVMALTALGYFIHPPDRPVTWIAAVFGAGLIAIELLPAYIHRQMIRVVSFELRGETPIQKQDREVGDERRARQAEDLIGRDVSRDAERDAAAAVVQAVANVERDKKRDKKRDKARDAVRDVAHDAEIDDG